MDNFFVTKIEHYTYYLLKNKGGLKMPENNLNLQGQNDRSSGCNNNNGIFGGLFGGNGCGCSNDSEILFFIIIFLLLFTNFGR